MSSGSSSSSSAVKSAVCGGLAGTSASLFTHPVELLKVRFQLRGEFQKAAASQSLASAISGIYRSDGFSGFYSGLSASIARQLVYSSSRFALFEKIKDGRNLSGWSLVGASAVAGVVGGVVSTPFDLVLIRMQSDKRLPEGQRRNYRNPLEALGRIMKQEGPGQLFRGISANVQRAFVITIAQFASYDSIKAALVRYSGHSGDSVKLQLATSFLTGLVVATVASPVDVLRTRVMNSTATSFIPQHASGAPAASPRPASTISITIAMLRTEGPLAFWKGLMPYYARVGPQVSIMFVAFEQYKVLWDWLGKKAKAHQRP